MPFCFRHVLTRIRISAHSLRIQTGRYSRQRLPRIQTGRYSRQRLPNIQTGRYSRQRLPRIQTGRYSRQRLPIIQTGRYSRQRLPRIQTGRYSRQRLPRIQTGRYSGQRLPRNERICLCCNTREIECEYHYILICPCYLQPRRLYVNQYYFNRPCVFKKYI